MVFYDPGPFFIPTQQFIQCLGRGRGDGLEIKKWPKNFLMFSTIGHRGFCFGGRESSIDIDKNIILM